jgi:hypothetical protein
MHRELGQALLTARAGHDSGSPYDAEQLQKKIKSTELRIQSLERKIRVLQGEDVLDAEAERAHGKERKDRLTAELLSLREELDMSARKVSVWYARKKRIQQEEPLRLAGEVAVSSEPVREAKDVFEQVTWDYLQTTEKLRFQPGDTGLQDRAAELAELRKEKLGILEQLIVKEINTFIDRSHEEIVHLTSKRDEVEKNLSEVHEDFKFLDIYTNGDQDAKTSFLAELTASQEIAQAQLQEWVELRNGGE